MGFLAKCGEVKRLWIVAVICAAFFSSVVSGAGFDEIKKEFETEAVALKQPLEKLDQDYVGALKKIQEAAQKNGDLDSMLLIKAEIEGFASGPVSGFEKSAELSKSRKIYDQAKAKRLAELQQGLSSSVAGYIQKLEVKIAELTKAGKLDEAIAGKKEQDRMKTLAADPKLLASVVLKIDTSRAAAVAAEKPSLAPVGAAESGAISVSTAARFVPLDQRPSGTLHFQGVNIGENHAHKLMDQRTGIVDVRCSWNRWLALKKDGTVIDSAYKPLADLKPAVAIAMGPHANIAYHADGTVSAWGKEALGIPADLGIVRDFGVGEGAGIAAMPDGSLRLWGSVYQDPDVAEKIVSKIKDVAFVSAGADLSWAATESGRVYQWRDKAFTPKEIFKASDVAQFEATFAGVVVLKTDGRLEGWNAWKGGLASKIPANVKKARKIKASWSSLVVQDEGGKWYGDGTAHPELLEVFKTFDENVIDVSFGSWTTNGLVGWIVKDE